MLNLKSQTHIYYSQFNFNQLQDRAIDDSIIRLNGNFLLFSQDSCLYLKGQYSNRKKAGEWISFYPNGFMKSRIIYPMNTKYYISEFYYLHGGKKEEWYRHQESDLRDSIYTAWYDNGVMKCRYHFKADELNGLSQEWDSSGNLRVESIYCSDKAITADCNCLIIHGSNGETFDMIYHTLWYQNGTKQCMLAIDSINAVYAYNTYDVSGNLKETNILSRQLMELGGTKFHFYKPTDTEVIEK